MAMVKRHTLTPADTIGNLSSERRRGNAVASAGEVPTAAKAQDGCHSPAAVVALAARGGTYTVMSKVL